MTASGSTAASILRQITGPALDALRGKYVYLTVVQSVPVGAPTSAGLIGLSSDGTGSSTQNARFSNQGQGGWRVAGIGPYYVPMDGTFLQARIWVDASAPPTAMPIHYQFACVTEGATPASPEQLPA